MTTTLSPSVESTTDSDTESSEMPVSGLSLEEAALLTPHDLIRWISYRITELRSVKTAWASLAAQKKGERSTTIAEAEWHATEMTQGFADSIPFEIKVATIILEDKLARPTE